MVVYIDRLEELMKDLTPNDFLTRQFLEETARLPRVESSFIISGLDETLFSRHEIRANEPVIKENPNNAMNRLIKFQIGIPYIIAKYYQGKPFPRDIVNQMNPNNALILTTGFEDIQKEKLQALWINNIPLRVLKKWDEKVLTTIQHILYELRYIPSEVIIYEDEPHYFIQYKELLEWILDCKITIMLVEMDGNKWYKKLEEV